MQTVLQIVLQWNSSYQRLYAYKVDIRAFAAIPARGRVIDPVLAGEAANTTPSSCYYTDESVFLCWLP